MNTKLDKILAEISAGELVDKITILEIKKNKCFISNSYPRSKWSCNVDSSRCLVSYGRF